MNELKVNGTQKFMGIDIPIVEGGFGENCRVMTANTIAKIHKVRMNDIQNIIKQNINEFEEGVDIIDLMKDENHYFLWKKMNLITSNRQKYCYLFSISGYIKYSSLIRNKNEDIFNYIISNYFKNNNKAFICAVQNKEIRFRNQLSTILNKFNIKYLFQYAIQQYKIDVYLPDFNIVIEYDENGHKYYTYETQELREQNIKDMLGCKFIRVTDEYSIDEAVSIVLKEIFEIKKELII